MDAYVVDKLNPVHMAGAAKFAKKLHNKGCKLADWRFINNKSDIVDFQILVGADHYYKIVNPFRLPIVRLGMFLKFDRFGRNFMFGRIPGSVLAKKQRQVNFVNIHSVGCNPSLIDYVKPHLPILNNSEVVNESITELPIFGQSEFIDESNACDVVKEINVFNTMRFQVSSSPEALETFTSNKYEDEKTNQCIAGFPRINDTSPIAEKLDSNLRSVLARFKDITFNISPLRGVYPEMGHFFLPKFTQNIMKNQEKKNYPPPYP